MRMLLALAFVDAKETRFYFKEIFETLDGNGKKIAMWYKSNYLGSTVKAAKYQPNFGLSLIYLIQLFNF